MQLSKRAVSIPPSITLSITSRVRELRKAGRDVIGFGAGEPDFDSPQVVRQAAIDAIEQGVTHYMPVPGTLDARTAIAEKLQRENGIDCTADHIVISTGAKHSINLALQVLVDPGAGHEVVVPTPAWVSYDPMVRLAGGTMVEVPAGPETDFRVSPEQLEAAITPATRAILINSPSNPCGTMYGPDEIGAIAEVVARHPHVAIISDEIYERLIYGDVAHRSFGSIPEIAEQVITVNGLSKAYAMTGWRVGYTCAPGDGGAVSDAIKRLQSQLTTCITSFCLPAIAVALREAGDEVERMREVFAARAALIHGLVARWPDVVCPRPVGAFYVFPDVSAHYGKTTAGGASINSAVDLATALLEEAGVAVVPGDGFGGPGPRHIRLSFACSEAQIETGCERIRALLEGMH